MSEREYVRRPERVKAVRWHKPGDHPDVERGSDPWDHPDVEQRSDGWDHAHWFELKTDSAVVEPPVVRPGDWIVERPDGARAVMSDADFRHAYEPAPTCDVRSQILALAELEDGWLDGDGKAYDPAALARVAALVDRLAAIHTAAVYPSPDGRVRLEWGERPRDDSLEIDPAAGRMAFHLYDHATGEAIGGVVEPDGEDDAREAEALALLRRLVAEPPWVESSMMADVTCHYCGADDCVDDSGNRRHEPDCPWIAARRLMEAKSDD